MTSLPPIVTTKQAAKMLGCGASTVGRFCKIGKLPAKKQSGMWLIDRLSVQELAKTYTPEGAREENGSRRAGMMRRQRIAAGKQVAADKQKSMSATQRAVAKNAPAQEALLSRIRELGKVS